VNRIVHVGPLRLALLAVVFVLAGMFVLTWAHGAGATAGYALGLEAEQAVCSEGEETLRRAAERMMADAYMDNAVLRDRLTLTQRQLQEARSLLAAEHERAEQASAERDRARSRLGIYERLLGSRRWSWTMRCCRQCHRPCCKKCSAAISRAATIGS